MKKTQKLYNEVQVFLDGLRAEAKRVEKDLELSFSLGDPVADVRVYMGEEAKKYYFDPKSEHAPVVLLTFDGAGYDYFGYNSEMPKTADEYREKLRKLAEGHGLGMEMADNCSMGFWPE